jgi:hypothetical protein
MVVRITSIALTIAGALALISGLLIWAGITLNLVSMHMLLGFLSVAALWIVGIGQALSTGGSWTIAACAIAIGALTAYVGLYQSTWMIGPFHWVIQAIHLLLGILTIGLGHVAAARQSRPKQERHR